MSEIQSKVVEIIVDKLGVKESEVVPEASFTAHLGADSLDQVELIMEFEKAFDLQIPDFSLRPPMGRTLPRNEISPVIATSQNEEIPRFLTGFEESTKIE